MRLTGKTACLLFLFILISPLYGEDSPSGPPEEGIFFFEDFFIFIFEEAFSFGESLRGEETHPDEEDLPSEETLSNEEPLLSEETLPAEEPHSVEEAIPDEEILLSGGALPSEEIPPSEDEDALMDDNAFFFEAPPLIYEVPTFEIRSFDTLFPHFSRRQRRMAMSNIGLRHYFMKDESAMLLPDPDLEIDILGSIMKKDPSHLIEALAIVPYDGRELDLLDIYNALGRIEKIKDYPASMNDNDFYVFTESTRIESARNRRAIPDPAPAVTLPLSETMYLRLKEVNFGNLFIRGDISISVYGITYSMTNFTDVRYFFLPIMKAEKFTTILYLEPVKEGILIYSMTGFYLPGFIADRVNLTPNINRRIEIFINWITDGLREKESAEAE